MMDSAPVAETLRDAVAGLWTADGVGDALVGAFRTLDRMPRDRGPRGAGNHWMRHKVEWADRLAQAELPEAERRERDAARNARIALRPDGTAIARMDTALDWLRELRAADEGLALILSLWALRAARGRSVRALCREKGWPPPTFYRQRARGLARIAGRLNARGAAVF